MSTFQLKRPELRELPDRPPPVFYSFVFPPPDSDPVPSGPSPRFLHQAETFTGKYDPTKHTETVKLLPTEWDKDTKSWGYDEVPVVPLLFMHTFTGQICLTDEPVFCARHKLFVLKNAADILVTAEPEGAALKYVTHGGPLLRRQQDLVDWVRRGGAPLGR